MYSENYVERLEDKAAALQQRNDNQAESIERLFKKLDISDARIRVLEGEKAELQGDKEIAEHRETYLALSLNEAIARNDELKQSLADTEGARDIVAAQRDQAWKQYDEMREKAQKQYAVLKQVNDAFTAFGNAVEVVKTTFTA